MSIRTITKALAGKEDLLLGNETHAQSRAGQSVEVTGLSAESLPLDAATSSTVKQLLQLTATTVELEDETHSINTSEKWIGKQVFNTTTGKPVYATGTLAADVWNDATGTTAHTPV
jgi:hypothetical protein